MVYDLTNPHGIVTVFDAKIYNPTTGSTPRTWAEVETAWKAKLPAAIIAELATATAAIPKAVNVELLATIDTLKFGNLVAAGPEVTITGGKRNNTLVKFGKSMRLEMQDALANVDALVAIGGARMDGTALTITENFPGPVAVVGDTFVIDQATGKEEAVKIVIFKFVPDAIPSIALAAGSAATFDLNGDVNAITVKTDTATARTFYAIVPKQP